MPTSSLSARVAGFFLGLAVASAAVAGDRIPDDPALRTGRLENGLTYFLLRNPKPAGRVELRLAVNAGSVLEDEDQRGLAHLVEHLCFRTTQHYPRGTMIAYLESIGAGFAADVNGQTTFDETVYRLAVPAEAGSFPSGVWDILRDWTDGVVFDPAEVDKERRVVLEERRLSLGAQQRLLEKSLAVQFGGSRYADRFPLGLQEVVAKAPLARIEQFYRDWYRPDNLALIVVGDIAPDKVEATIRQKFSEVKLTDAKRSRPDLAVAEPGDWRCTGATDPELGSALLRLSFPKKAKPITTAKDFDDSVCRRLALQALNVRLDERRNQPGCAWRIARASFGGTPARGREETLLFALADPVEAEAGLASLVQESERVRRWGLTEQEFQREKANLRKAFALAYTQREDREADALADRATARFLRGEAMASAEWEHERVEALLDKLSLDEENALAKSLFERPGAIVRVEMPEPKGGGRRLPDERLAEIAREARRATVEPYREHQVPAALMSTLPKPGQITKKTEVAAGLTELEFANGVKVILKPSRFKKDEVLFSAFRTGGIAALPDELDLAGKCVLGYVMESGVGPFSKTDLQAILAGKQVMFSLPPDPNFDLIKGQASAGDLETALQLLHLAFAEPRPDPAAYQRMLGQNQAFEANVALNPQGAFYDDLLDHRFQHHPRGARLIQPAEAWKALSLEKILAAYRARFSSARGYTFIFVGSFEPDTIEPLLARYLGSLPGGEPAPGARDLGIRSLAGPHEETIEHGIDPHCLVVLTDEREAEWNLRDSHLVWSLGNILQRILMEKLRIEKGSVYGLLVSSRLEKTPAKLYDLELVVPCAPEGLAAVEQTVNAEMARIMAGGLTADEISQEVEAQKRALEKQAAENGDWLWKLELIYKNDEGLDRVTDPECLLRLLTPENLQGAAKRFWRTDRWVKFVWKAKPPAPGGS